jgi:hypothetical protein
VFKLSQNATTQIFGLKGVLFLISGLLLFQNCSKIAISEIPSQGKAVVNSVPPPKDVVCDPLSSNGTVATNGGLIGSLFYKPDQASNSSFGQVSDFFSSGIKSSQTLYLSQLNVPTRRFTEGFFKQDNSLIRKDNGEVLVEWFALHLESVLKLTTRDLIGKYQFGVLSDDGSIFTITESNGQKTRIQNDGLHGAQFACASPLVSMDASSRLPMSMDYFQGPREHIALIAMWRKVSDSETTAPNEPLCGQGAGDNEFFFDSNVSPSQPQQAYNDLLARGWKPIAMENFELPNNAQNPCH